MWLNILYIILAVYLGLSLIFYFFQHFFFFRPELLPSHFTYKYPFDFEEKTFEMEDGGQINSIHFKVPNSRGVIYYLKGNSRSIKGWGKFAKDFVSNGYDFFMMDYRGFGKSRGRRTEQKLYNDAQMLYKWIARQYTEDKIVVYGRSLGSGIAARVASWNNPRMLILDSPYYSFYHQIKRYGAFLPLRLFLRYQIRTDQFLKNLTFPVYIIHGTKDRLIPFEHSERLQKINPQLIQLLEVEGGGHNNLPSFPTYHEYLYDILNEYQTQPAEV
ncbi:MAG: alpha/beta fold hydrolase [Saprospiraceae bacterium]|nr:alpha/beta fold hydrolase [Saprospiraceae bacterium]